MLLLKIEIPCCKSSTSVGGSFEWFIMITKDSLKSITIVMEV